MAIIFAFCCLLCSSCNDFIFKLFARKPRPRGLFVFAIGIFWSLAAVLLPGLKGASWQLTITWGLISGFFSVVGNILLIESMGKESAGLCSTIYRLNLALVVPGAALIFNEQNNLHQYIGIVMALAAVLCFFPGSESNQQKKSGNIRWGLYMVIIAAVLRAAMGLSYKYGFKLGASENGVNMINGFCWIIGGLIYSLIKERQMFNKNELKNISGYGFLSGMFVLGICYFMAQSVARGNASVVLPIMQMSFVLTFALSVLFLKEKLTPWKLAALGCGTAALLLLSIKFD